MRMMMNSLHKLIETIFIYVLHMYYIYIDIYSINIPYIMQYTMVQMCGFGKMIFC